MKWLKKWYYLLLLTGSGVVYLTVVDHWQIYAEPLRQMQKWYQELTAGGALPVDARSVGEENSGTCGIPGGSNSSVAESDSSIVLGNETGSGNSETEGSGNGVGNPWGAEGSGNRADSPWGVSGSGNGSDSSWGVSGSGNGSDSSWGVPGSGNGADNSWGVPGSGNSGVPGEGNDPSRVQYMTVEDDYFADAVFIGDSRTVGMFEYGGLEEISTFYASTGLTVYKIFDSEIVSVPGERKKISVEEALEQNSFAKIYLMIGINEMGTGTVESFLEKYQEVVNHLRELQPDAVIYLQAIMKVTAERSAQGDYITNEGIVARNEGIAGIADNEKIFFLDVNPLVCDETGGMVPDYTFDGVHLKAKYIQIWKDFLKTHAISS